MTEISVSKQSVKEFLSTGVNNTFVIPDYQRPYSWTVDEAQTLFDDIWEFSLNGGGLTKKMVPISSVVSSLAKTVKMTHNVR